MNTEQAVMDMQKEIVEIKTKQRNDHARIEENKALATRIHEVSVNLAHLTEQLKGQNQRMDKLIDTFDNRLKSQGERIGRLDSAREAQEVTNAKTLERLDALESDAKEQNNKGSRRWDAVVEKIVFFILGAVLIFIAYQFGLG